MQLIHIIYNFEIVNLWSFIHKVFRKTAS